MNHTKIPLEEYKKIVEYMPISCVDIVLHQNKKVLLVKRTQEPKKDQWWLPGGRIYKNETIRDAAKRKIHEELGIDCQIEKSIGTYDFFSRKSSLDGIETGTHAIAVCFTATPQPNAHIAMDKTSSEYRWITEIEHDLDPYVKQILKDSGVLHG